MLRDRSLGSANATPLRLGYLFRAFVVSSFRVPFSEFEVTTNRVPGSVPLSEQGPAEIEQKVTKITKGRNRSGTGRRALFSGPGDQNGDGRFCLGSEIATFRFSLIRIFCVLAALRVILPLRAGFRPRHCGPLGTARY